MLRCTEELLLRLPRPIALVGNGTPSKPCGADIDAHASVIRMNNYKLSGYAELVGNKVTARCATGWINIQIYPPLKLPEFTPFTETVMEARKLREYRARIKRRVLAARFDVHPLIPETARPSTGFALVQLAAHLGLELDLYGFDGFKTPHYWRRVKYQTVHSPAEFEALCKRPGMTVHN